MKVKNRPFYASRNDDNSLVDIDVLDFMERTPCWSVNLKIVKERLSGL